jgi:predicted negative regulator of RcsB-dependent stress response
MGKDFLEDIKKTSSQLTGKLQDLSKNKEDQKKLNKTINDIKKLQKNMESDFQHLGPLLAKVQAEKQDFNNTNNGIKRALNQPTEGNIQNAISKMNDFVAKLAA